MSNLRQWLETAGATALETARELRVGYQRANDFARMRIWIVGALIADLVIVIAVIAVVGRSSVWVEVAFQRGFPADMLILRNLHHRPLRDVRVVLDGEYEAFIDVVEGERTVGLELVREFRDDRGDFPPSGYEPGKARVEWRGRTETHDVPEL